MKFYTEEEYALSESALIDRAVSYLIEDGEIDVAQYVQSTVLNEADRLTKEGYNRLKYVNPNNVDSNGNTPYDTRLLTPEQRRRYSKKGIYASWESNIAYQHKQKLKALKSAADIKAKELEKELEEAKKNAASYDRDVDPFRGETTNVKKNIESSNNRRNAEIKRLETELQKTKDKANALEAAAKNVSQNDVMRSNRANFGFYNNMKGVEGERYLNAKAAGDKDVAAEAKSNYTMANSVTSIVNGKKSSKSNFMKMNNSVELVNTAMTLIESGNVEAAQILLSQVLNEANNKDMYEALKQLKELENRTGSKAHQNPVMDDIHKSTEELYGLLNTNLSKKPKYTTDDLKKSTKEISNLKF